jgi:hypothetical protein
MRVLNNPNYESPKAMLLACMPNIILVWSFRQPVLDLSWFHHQAYE